MAIELKAVAREEVAAQGVKVRRGDLDGDLAIFARQVPVHDAGQVVNGRWLSEVRVHHQVQLFKLLQYSIDGRGTDFWPATLDGARYFVDGQVSFGAD